MAKTVKSAFETYKGRLELTDRQEGLIGSRRATVVGVLAQKLELRSSTPALVIGSWDRKTLTRHLSEGDVDVMVVLDYSKNKDWDSADGTVKVLRRFKAILQSETIYKDTPMRRDRNCVTMQFSEFRLDLVPAFKNSGGYYRIPDSSRKRWVDTDPITFAASITAVNQAMHGTFVPLIKMVKGWNREEGWPIRSFHLECLLYHHYKTYTQSYTYPSTLRRFFGMLPAYLSSPCYDPVRGDRVDSYLDASSLLESKRDVALRKARNAGKKSERAMEAEKAGKEEKAIRIWKALMGEFFPTYG